MTFYDWLFSLSMFSRFIHVLACISTLFLFYDQIISPCIDIPFLFINSPVDGLLDCFHLGAVMNNVAINICVQVFVWTYVFFSLGYT